MIFNLSKDKVMNFSRSRHNFLLFFLFSMWTLADTSDGKYHLILTDR